MFWLRNKKFIFLLHTFNKSPAILIGHTESRHSWFVRQVVTDRFHNCIQNFHLGRNIIGYSQKFNCMETHKPYIVDVQSEL